MKSGTAPAYLHAIDAAEQFRAAIQAAGLTPPDEIEADGRLRRFATNGKRDDLAGWYVLFCDGVPAGSYGCWRSGISETWCANIGRALTDAEASEHRERVEAMRRLRDEEAAQRQLEAAARAASIWQEATPATAEHEYLARKGVEPHGLHTHEGRLVVPLRDSAGALHSLQLIATDGSKRFLPGGRVTGFYFSIGSTQGEATLCIAEGFATAASIHEATGRPVAVAFNAGNLLPVAKALRERYPEVTLIICADDDAGTDGNPGLTKATEAAQAVDGLLAVPGFGTDRPDGATDFNDLATAQGPEAVRRCIKADGTVMASSCEWQEPRPITAALHPVPAFDPEALLPDALRGWVMDEADRMPCPPDYIAAAALVALGSIIGARCAIKPKARDAWLIVPNLWGGIVGLPSAKKSPAISSGLKPLDRLIALAMKEHQKDIENYEAEKLVFEAQAAAIQDKIKKAAKSSNGSNGSTLSGLAADFQSHRAAAPEAPSLRRYKSNDSTIEKLGELLRENPAGLLVLRDELAGLIASWDREGREGERAFYLEAWNGTEGFDTDRIGRGSIFIPNLCVSLFGGIQPDMLVAYLEQAAHALANDGMLQRFQLMVYPDHRAWEWRDRMPAKDARDCAFGVFNKLAEFDPTTCGALPADDISKFPFFRFDEAAQEIFIEWSTNLHRERLISH